MEKTFVLYDSDLFYTTRFVDYFQKKKASVFHVSAFTQKESLIDFLQTHRIEILLLGPDHTVEDLPLEKINYIYELTDIPTKRNSSEKLLVYQYQSAEAVLNEILDDYRKKENSKATSNSRCRTSILSVFAPVSGIEKLSYAWALSSLMSEREKVLFIQIELVPVQLLPELVVSNPSLTEFIYYLKENSDVISKLNELISYSGNLAYLSGVTHGADILSLNQEDIKRWMEELGANSNFDVVIFYLGCYTEPIMDILYSSDKVVIASNGMPYEKAVIKEWEEQMSRSGKGISKGRWHLIDLPTELGVEHIPFTKTELKQSTWWSLAEQNLNESL